MKSSFSGLSSWRLSPRTGSSSAGSFTLFVLSHESEQARNSHSKEIFCSSQTLSLSSTSTPTSPATTFFSNCSSSATIFSCNNSYCNNFSYNNFSFHTTYTHTTELPWQLLQARVLELEEEEEKLKPLPVPDRRWLRPSVDFINGLPASLTTEGNEVTNVMVVTRFASWFCRLDVARARLDTIKMFRCLPG
jgi:hypothetical protein